MRPIAPAPPTTAIRAEPSAALTRESPPRRCAVREPERLPLGHEVEVHVLGLAEGVEPFLAELASHAALAHAAKRRGVVVGERIVDPERAGLDLLHRASAPTSGSGVDVGAEAVLRCAAAARSLRRRPSRPESTRSARTLPRRRRVSSGCTSVEHGRRVEPARARRRGRRPPSSSRAPCGDRALHLLLDARARPLGDQRSEVGLGIHAVADPQRSRVRDEPLDERLRRSARRRRCAWRTCRPVRC